MIIYKDEGHTDGPCWRQQSAKVNYTFHRKHRSPTDSENCVKEDVGSINFQKWFFKLRIEPGEIQDPSPRHSTRLRTRMTII